MVLHHIKPADILWLADHFATRTQWGWCVPNWVWLLRRTARKATHGPAFR